MQKFSVFRWTAPLLWNTAALVTLAMPALAPPADAQGKLPLPIQEHIRPLFPGLDLGARQSRGQDAINRLGIHLNDVAAWYGKSGDQLRKALLSDNRMRVDKTGRILYVEELGQAVRAEQAPTVSQSSIQDGALTGLDQTFYLHSHPGANRTIYLDFTGATITNTAWNSNGNTITATPYDIDGNPAAFSTAELQRIQYIWQRVAEDYAPFDVDVTTQQPSPDLLTRADANDQVFGTTVVITKTAGVYPCNCGGIAYVGVFNYTGGSKPPDYYKPAFVFFDMLGSGNEKFVAEAISHEAGHNMGLHHDGTSADAYYAGQGNDGTTGWAPIMGVGYYRPLVQFSKGEYSDANNKEEDFVIAQNFGLPLRLDDYGSNIATATPFVQGTSGNIVSGSMDGVVETANDRDVFAIAAGPGTIQATVMPANRSPDMDLVLTLLDGSGNVLVTANPLNALQSSITYNVLTQGSYYLEVRGTGQGNPAIDGYSNYGSVGNFRLTASYTVPAGTSPVAVINATPTNGQAPMSVTLDGTASYDDGRVAYWYWDFGDGNNDVSGSLSTANHVYQVAGNYLARLTVVDDTGLSASTTQVINVIPTAPQSFARSIQIVLKTNSKGYAWAIANVTVVNQNGKLLKGAKVSVTWSGIVQISTTAKTKASGIVTLTSPKTKASGCFNLTISGIISSGYPFNGASAPSSQVCR
ncbi:PKD domain-containing protein [Aestuariivirga sp.]|uniref:PKD domain-containing protein n=1 Tax=Aestuariivirga sp. TaxID=2650926 RepID=UPI003016A947